MSVSYDKIVNAIDNPNTTSVAKLGAGVLAVVGASIASVTLAKGALDDVAPATSTKVHVVIDGDGNLSEVFHQDGPAPTKHVARGIFKAAMSGVATMFASAVTLKMTRNAIYKVRPSDIHVVIDGSGNVVTPEVITGDDDTASPTIN